MKSFTRKQPAKALLGILLFLAGSACEHKFSKEKWKQHEDIEYTKRKYIVDDLLSNYPLKGIKYNKLVNLLGLPDDVDTNRRELIYSVETDYGWDIDPVRVKNLYIGITKDSVVAHVKLKEWNKGDLEE